eukprot:609522-Prymnesium_polylepis.1
MAPQGPPHSFSSNCAIRRSLSLARLQASCLLVGGRILSDGGVDTVSPLLCVRRIGRRPPT